MPARRTSRSFARRAPPNRSWSRSFTAAPIVVAAATKVLLGTFVLSNPGIDETILRTVGMLSIQSDQGAASEDQIGAFGMILVRATAAAAGAASIPGPITEGGDDGWFTYVPFAQRFTFLSGVGFDAVGGSNISFDSKAKRRAGEDQVVALMVENAHATHGLQISFVLRMLSQVSGT